MIKKMTSARILKLGSIASVGMLFQAGGCAIDELLPTLINTAVGLAINSFVGNFLGVAGGF